MSLTHLQCECINLKGLVYHNFNLISIVLSIISISYDTILLSEIWEHGEIATGRRDGNKPRTYPDYLNHLLLLLEGQSESESSTKMLLIELSIDTNI